MDNMLFAALSACWLGMLTAISPCPLAINIAAVSFVGRKAGSTPLLLAAGLLYMLGRTLTYVVLGAILVQGLLATPKLSYALQKYMNLMMGPLLILVAMVMLKLLALPEISGGIAEKLRKHSGKMGVGGAGLLGVAFALSFCPISAALFFGSLLPLATKFESALLLPSVYGMATGLPVLLFTFLLAFCTSRINMAYKQISEFEKWAQRVTGVIFLLLGIHFTITISIGIQL